MTLFLNFVIPTFLVFMCFVSYILFDRAKTVKDKVKVVMICLVIAASGVYVYNAVYKTALPKGTVQKMPSVVIEEKQLEIKDLTVKPVERDSINVREEVKKVLEE